MSDLSDMAQLMLGMLKQAKGNMIDERMLMGNNPDAVDDGTITGAIAELQAAGVDLKVSKGSRMRMIVLA
jgi:hypothetical protein